MQKRTARAVVIVCVFVGFIVALFVVPASIRSSNVHERTRRPRVIVVYHPPSTPMAPGPSYELMVAQWTADELAAEAAQAAADEAARVAAEQEAARLEAERQRAALAPAPSSSGTLSPTGGCCTHTDAWWHGVAICEQGGRNDPYFGYFSFMDGSMGGQPWDVQVAAGNALLNRVGHEVGPWAAACVAAGYAASPSG